MYKIDYVRKNFKKASPDEFRAVVKGIEKLSYKINEYEANGTQFELIDNDTHIKHVHFGKSYYVYKTNHQQFPLRILYRFIREGEHPTIQVHMSYLKKYNTIVILIFSETM